MLLRPKHQKGATILYKRGNILDRAIILAVHLDHDMEPYYTIRLNDGKEKQTDNAHLVIGSDDDDLRSASTFNNEVQKPIGSYPVQQRRCSDNDSGNETPTSNRVTWNDNYMIQTFDKPSTSATVTKGIPSEDNKTNGAYSAFSSIIGEISKGKDEVVCRVRKCMSNLQNIIEIAQRTKPKNLTKEMSAYRNKAELDETRSTGALVNEVDKSIDVFSGQDEKLVQLPAPIRQKRRLCQEQPPMKRSRNSSYTPDNRTAKTNKGSSMRVGQRKTPPLLRPPIDKRYFMRIRQAKRRMNQSIKSQCTLNSQAAKITTTGRHSPETRDTSVVISRHKESTCLRRLERKTTKKKIGEHNLT
jgi:hypothetical protein